MAQFLIFHRVITEFPPMAAHRYNFRSLVEEGFLICKCDLDFFSQTEVTSARTTLVGMCFTQDFPRYLWVVDAFRLEFPHICGQCCLMHVSCVVERFFVVSKPDFEASLRETYVGTFRFVGSFNVRLIHNTFRQTLSIKGALVLVAAVT